MWDVRPARSGAEKAVDFAKEHELDQKAKFVGESLKEGFKEIGNTMKDTFGNKD